MTIDITAKNIELDQPLKVFVEEKVGGLEHFLPNAQDLYAHVEIGKSTKHHHKGPFFYAEANLRIGQSQHLFRASVEHEDLRAAITDVKDELQIQIKKFKEKVTDAEHQPAS